MTEVECAWVAGLLEGEGCFGFGPPGNRVNSKRVRQLRITCAMTDLDTIEKLHRIVGVGGIGRESRKDKRREHAKPLWVWHASKRADVTLLLRAVRPHMGTRRGVKVDELLTYAAANPLIYGRPVEHGTLTSFRRGCRCMECMAARASYARGLRRRKATASEVPENQDS